MKISQAIDFENLIPEVTPNFTSSTTIGDLINVALTFIFPIAGILLLIFLVFAGYQWLTSGDNPKSLASAKQRLTYAIAGFIIIFLAYWITVFVGKVLGLEAVEDIF